MDIKKKLALSEYNRVYGGLLTEHQQEMLSLYYDCDVSLNELAEQFDISRQAVRDAIIRGEKALLDFEDKLQLVKTKGETIDLINKTVDFIQTGKSDEALKLLDVLRAKEE